jgi:hypothetical protein
VCHKPCPRVIGKPLAFSPASIPSIRGISGLGDRSTLDFRFAELRDVKTQPALTRTLRARGSEGSAELSQSAPIERLLAGLMLPRQRATDSSSNSYPRHTRAGRQ